MYGEDGRHEVEEVCAVVRERRDEAHGGLGADIANLRRQGNKGESVHNGEETE